MGWREGSLVGGTERGEWWNQDAAVMPDSPGCITLIWAGASCWDMHLLNSMCRFEEPHLLDGGLPLPHDKFQHSPNSR